MLALDLLFTWLIFLPNFRTVIDFMIAVGHIAAGIHPLAGSPNGPEHTACQILGVVNEFALISSNLWYIFLAVDLLRAIRNPFQ